MGGAVAVVANVTLEEKSFLSLNNVILSNNIAKYVSQIRFALILNTS
jgi:hypothetical protein